MAFKDIFFRKVQMGLNFREKYNASKVSTDKHLYLYQTAS